MTTLAEIHPDLETAPIAVTLGWEVYSGFDSIPTMEEVYEQTPGGAYVCIHPGCKFARKDTLKLWVHVHGPAHGQPHYPPRDFDYGRHV